METPNRDKAQSRKLIEKALSEMVPLNRKTALSRLNDFRDDILGARDRGFTVKQIMTALARGGIKTDKTTLGRFLRTARKEPVKIGRPKKSTEIATVSPKPITPVIQKAIQTESKTNDKYARSNPKFRITRTSDL